ncbi:thioredoxin domain-containing protein [Dermacoccus barathri]|uniref:Thioredoxin domain-containing protein n=1 Tax=Dermacoccus barathri TaxID=322601 RepID=A0ABN2BQ55_9MICO
MANRLAASLSPYLRQHADNPVDWREWDDAAFAEARERDVPILLSVGYAACHWCHVMAHESFEDPEVAAAVNANFVAIKVDREERPDIDAVYMNVTQALTGHGGWPMTVFLTPDAAPLYAGTYFPRDHFLQVLSAIDDIWRTDRERAESSGRAIVEAVSGMTAKAPTGVAEFDDEALAASITTLRREFDDARGGFGGAPKFPPSMTLEHLLRHHARTGDADALAMAERTCEAMARGGMYDQLDGGFARYSVDAAWVVPHFEKMLYDNAQLLRVYAHLWRATGSAPARRVTVETAEFMLRRLLTDEGAFASALDADTDGVEGLTYAWTPAQLVEVLGDEDGARAARLLEVTPHGTFEHGSSTLQRRRDPGDVFAPDEVGDPDAWWHDVRSRLLAARDRRPQPARDDKVVTSWNGLAIAALAEAAMILDEPRWLDAARTAADVVLESHVMDGRLRRTSLGGGVSEALGCADDYGNLAEGLLVLHQATGEARYLTHATELLDASRDLFVTDGVVYDTGSDAEQLFTRPRSTGDNAEPCGASALASAAVMAFALTGEADYREFAEVCLGQLGAVARQAPRFAGWALAAAEALAAGPVQVAIVSDGASPDTDAMATGAWQATSPGLVRVVGRTDAEGVPLLADRPATGGRATAYVCRGFVCDAPTTDVGELERSLREV